MNQPKNGIYTRRWDPQSNIKAAVLLVHGLGEHCQRYQYVAEQLNKAGYALAAIDLPGHGESAGKRGHIDSFDDYQNAILNLYEQMLEWYADKKVLLLGHSMGGLISTRLLLQHQGKFAAAALSGAAIQSPQQPPGWQVAIIKLIARLFPKAGMITLDASGISKDKTVVDAYMNDPLVNKGKLSARFLVTMFEAMTHAQTQGNKISLPILIMHGENDPMTAPAGSRLLYDSVSSKIKQLKIYPDLMHEIFNEPERDQVLQNLIDWFDEQI